MFKIVFYENSSGKSEVRDYLNSLRSKGSSTLWDIINRHLRKLEAHGTRIGSPTVKHIEGKLWELRPSNNRIFFFYWKDDTLVLLHYFIKKTQKTPKKEIQKALSNMEDFLDRNK